MISFKSFAQQLFQVNSKNFEELALGVFRFQVKYNSVYNEYVNHLNIKPENIKSVTEIPFLPISFFREHKIKSGNWESEASFRSSGTTGDQKSVHYIKDVRFYNRICQEAFKKTYGDLNQYTFLALLPSYLERHDSSLIYMVNDFINSGTDLSGFYLNNTDDLIKRLNLAKEKKHKIILIGVSFALLELAENNNLDLENVIVMETGGMKGRRKELVRGELHNTLTQAFRVDSIHSEYGMTELLSQAYAQENGLFKPPPWMKVYFRDLNDPFDIEKESGGINVIDLANFNTCSFIETQDLGKSSADDTFEVLGRFDNSEIRGCNLLVSTH